MVRGPTRGQSLLLTRWWKPRAATKSPKESRSPRQDKVWRGMLDNTALIRVIFPPKERHLSQFALKKLLNRCLPAGRDMLGQAMATNRILLCTFLVLLSIIVSISANRSADQAIENDNSRLDMFLGCFRLFERYQFPFDEYDSIQDEMGANICNTASRVWQSMYENTGRFPPGYKEALLIWYKNNQTMVDIEICRSDHRRCPEELQKIAFSSLFDYIYNLCTL
ncbi:hypothetical protein CASFOL_041076 [Castilleja foliolosa]|uniref:Uncharacterized protein n=1 Tax=Castilleja foliolosa TaxID=1961234 RepID=A0ABD3BF38_9LAMI